MKGVRVIAALDRRGPAAAIARLRARRDVDLEVVSGAARAASSAWQRRAALVIFELGEKEAGASAGAGALDAIQALRAEPSTVTVPILLMVPEGRVDLRDQGFAAGASDVCWAGQTGAGGFEEALLHLAGIPIRRYARRPVTMPVRISLDGSTWRDAVAMNLSPGGVQLRWEGDVPAPGAVLRVEIDGSPLHASVQGGTKVGAGLLTRLRFVGLTAEERTRLDAVVSALPGPDEPEPELTPAPDDPPPEPLPRRFAPSRYSWGIAIGATLLAVGLAAHFVSSGPLEEPARLSLGAH